ncbi:hypothetical protein QUF58_04940 [Anaerolineales bacterium HSG24]|nr:hypothetical protein [Anaerolineales bacterium HSG24]
MIEFETIRSFFEGVFQIFPLCFSLSFFILMYGVVSFLLANTGGWAGLAEHYQLQDSFEGQKWHFRSGRMGLINYKSCLIVGTNDEGLYLAVLPIFRISHPPLFIPWEDITTSESKRLVIIPYLDFTFACVPSVTLKLPAEFGNTVLYQD